MSESTWRVGFIGVGRMGGAMSRNLLESGHEVTVYDPSAEAVDRCVRAGATPASDTTEAVSDKDIVFTSVPMPRHLAELYIGPRSVASWLARGTVCVDVSTVDPGTVRLVEEAIVEHAAEFIACPVGKGPAQAEAGEIPLFAGGAETVVERCRHVLEAIGTPLYHLGTPAAASMFKLISNLVGMANLAALAEGERLARLAGIESDAFEAALRDTGAHSAQVDMRLSSLAEGDHFPRFAVDLAAKDVRLAVHAAAEWSQPVPVSAAALQQLLAASAHGFGDADVTAMGEVLARTE